MNVRKISLIVLTLLATAALAGAVNAQQDPTPAPNQQWQQGQNDPNCGSGQGNQDQCYWWNNGQGQQGQNDPNGSNGQGYQGQNGWNNGQGQQGQNDPNCRGGQDSQCHWWNNGQGQQGRHDPRDYRGGQYGRYGWPYTYTPPQPQYVAPTIVSPTEADILSHIVQIVADALNLPQSDVTSEMTSMTLAQIIQAHNGNLDTITNQVLAGLLDWIGGGINDNTITPTRANQILDNLQGIVQRALNGEFTQNGTTVTGLLNV